MSQTSISGRDDRIDACPDELGVELGAATSWSEERTNARGREEPWAPVDPSCGAETAPRPVSWVSAQSRAHRVENDVSQDLEEVILRLDNPGSESCLEQVAGMSVALVESAGEEAVESMHPSRKRPLAECEHKMKVVGHQAIGEASPIAAV
jgi:hypothetical protein